MPVPTKYKSSIYNPNDWDTATGSSIIAGADYIKDITAGTANPSKALVLDTEGKISGINYVATSNTTRDYVNTTQARSLQISSITLNDNITTTGNSLSFTPALSFFGRPTFTSTNTSTTINNAYSFYISGEPIAGTNVAITNPWALYINSGNMYLNGTLRMGATSNSQLLGIYQDGTSYYGLGATSSQFRLHAGVGASFRFIVDSAPSTTGSLALQINNNGQVETPTTFKSKNSSQNYMASFLWNSPGVTTQYYGMGAHDTTSSLRVRFAMVDSADIGTGAFALGPIYPTLFAAAFTASSDIRLKNTIEPMKPALDTVLKLNPVSYFLNQDADKTDPQIGFIAQELHELIPEVVQTGDSDWGVNYGRLTAILTKAIQEQQEQIETLKTELNELQDAKSYSDWCRKRSDKKNK